MDKTVQMVDYESCLGLLFTAELVSQIFSSRLFFFFGTLDPLDLSVHNMASVYKSAKAQESEKKSNGTVDKRINKQRVLLLSSRGITFR